MPLTTEQFKSLKKRFLRKRDMMDSEWRDQWLDISNHVAPSHGRFIDRRDSTAAKGGDKTKKILNSSATRDAKIAAAGMKGGLTPHSLPWFKLGLQDKDLAKWEPARLWLGQVQDLMYRTFSRSNFYHIVHNVYYEELLFGTGPMFIGEDSKTQIHCKTWTVGEYVVSVDEQGRVDAAYRWFWLSASAAASRFGKEKLTPRAQDLCRNNPDEHIQIIHCIFKRTDPNYLMKDNLNFPWGSVYWEFKGTGDLILGESGYNTNPLMYPRWDIVGEDSYGSSCPGMETIGDVKMLQKMERDKLQAVHKVVDPPLTTPVKLHGRLSTLPGSHNPISSNDRELLRPLYQISPDIGAIRQEIRDIEERIGKGYYNDLFLMILDAHTMTATEVVQRHEDKLSILGPVIERQMSELLSPTIDRTFDVMSRGENIPPPPEELIDMELEVEYVSLLAQAQKMVGTQSIEKQIRMVGEASGLNEEIIDTIDFDEVSEQYAEMNGTPPKIIRSREAVIRIRADRAKRQQVAAQQEQAAALASTGKDLAQIPVGAEENNAASNILGQMIDQ